MRLEFGREKFAHQILEDSCMWWKNLSLKLCGHEGRTGHECFLLASVGGQLGEAASQQEDSKAFERGSSTRTVWRQGKRAIYSKGRS